MTPRFYTALLALIILLTSHGGTGAAKNDASSTMARAATIAGDARAGATLQAPSAAGQAAPTETAPSAVTATAVVTATRPTVTPRSTQPSATATPTVSASNQQAEKLLVNARWLQLIGNCAGARRELASLLDLNPAATVSAEANFRMAQCYIRDEAYDEAVIALQDLFRTAGRNEKLRTPAQFLLGDALSGAGLWKEAEAAFAAYLPLVPDLDYLTWQRIGAIRKIQGNLPGAAEAYRLALAKSPDWTNTMAIRRNLADLALALGNPPEAVAQYDALRGNTTKGAWAAEMQYLAGNALAQRTQAAAITAAVATIIPSATPPTLPVPAAALTRWQAAVDADITSRHAHASIVALLDAGAPVDEFQRGVANYYNKGYALAIAALDRLRAAEPDGRQGLAWYYSGLSYLGLGETDKGVADLDHFIEKYPQSPQYADAWMAKARGLQRVDRDLEAVATFRKLPELRPESPLAPQALYQAAALQAWLSPDASAADAYVAMARKYPAVDEAWRSYQASGLIYFRAANWPKAAQIWREMAEASTLPAFSRPVASFWLGRALHAQGDDVAARQAWQAAQQASPDSFYGLRAAAWLAGTPEAMVREANPGPVTAVPANKNDETSAIAEWLATWAGPGKLILPDTIRNDPDWKRGQALMSLGRKAEALVQFERVRKRHDKEPWALSALSIAFRDAGANRLSLLSAEQVVTLSGKPMRSAPAALQRLAYPMAYGDLIRSEAKRQNLDPRLLAAIVRQESRFEAGVASVAGAQGLMQVMPATAEGIARQMKWPDFEARQAYWPYVNVAFGAFYVRQWLSHFDGSMFAALAAYNGGPGNAGPWYNQSPEDEDLFAAIININETRVYVQAVYSNYEVYSRLYSK